MRICPQYNTDVCWYGWREGVTECGVQPGEGGVVALVGNRELRGIFGEVVQSAAGSRAGAEGAGAGVVQGGPPTTDQGGSEKGPGSGDMQAGGCLEAGPSPETQCTAGRGVRALAWPVDPGARQPPPSVPAGSYRPEEGRDSSSRMAWLHTSGCREAGDVGSGGCLPLAGLGGLSGLPYGKSPVLSHLKIFDNLTKLQMLGKEFAVSLAVTPAHSAVW